MRWPDTYTGEEWMELQRLLSVSTLKELRKLSAADRRKRIELLAQQAISGQERVLESRSMKHRVIGSALLDRIPESVPPEYRPDPRGVQFTAYRELLIARMLTKKPREEKPERPA